MRVIIEGSKIYFDTEGSGESPVRAIDLSGVAAEIDTRGEFVVVDTRRPGTAFRGILKYDRTGVQQVMMYVYTDSRVEIDDDSRSFHIDGVRRDCPGLIWHVTVAPAGELVVLEPSTAPDPTRNLYRYNSDGSLRWQLGPREFRPLDRIIWGDFIEGGAIRAMASMNGWSAEVDDETGAIGRISTNER